MRNPTPRDLRNAVVIAALLSAIVTMALLDRSCHTSAPLNLPATPSR